ncbi:PH domain-containing protein [Halorubrum vacuolatum]|uniref:Short C-terminal domain-containing protein n=1 Tax=Halorubrum vacuolatum TaxID=63740 RepID=A0A238VK98_HALVU|nr:PH domain-containing protein [Halorubrum vacuolatum]SNR34537.1 Short C-terminal domain-containing protein [Halorubrum vacuolatum]
MGLFDNNDDAPLENADLDCQPQNEFVSKSEVKKIDEYLDPGEKVHFLAVSAGEGFEIDGESIGDVSAQRTAVTDKRIVIKKKRGLFGLESQSIWYDNISSVDLSSGLVNKRLRVETSSKVYGIGIGGLADDAAENMSNFIRTKVSQANQSGSNSGGTSDDPLDKLERLRDLKDEGVITEQELEEKKSDILDQI